MTYRNQLTLAILVLFSPVLLSAQTPLGEQLGGLTTRFTIITDSLVILNDSEQLLIKRGVSNAVYSRPHSMGYGAGYESLHLEFVADQAMEVVSAPGNDFERPLPEFFNYAEDTDGINEKRRLRMRFFDAKLREIARLNRLAITASSVPTSGLPVFYSIDLRGIPLPLLEQTSTIDLVWEE